ncbi:nuclear pore complex protein Nup107-like isoform X1 [Strongylocentrotus purpuratus]|uniref:Nuclear pore complex protein n=2 Tax=Strongylocentrotus purpuratus TaxID=7668 RepID=A0A7M7T2E7_STRPU|nr:nuclear pore complex protein Nup107-like isoform X1 [Strongylocentrotus purpuratus]|eukprot:XP_791160.3 PREDICTED: nuclear pore complex protein Nup107 isoform X2 [Strongylocentrotus purpuratus]
MATFTAGKKNVRKKESAGRPSDRASGSFVEPGDTTMADIWKYSQRPDTSFDPHTMNRSIDQRRDNRRQGRQGDLSFSILDRSIEPREELRSNVLQNDRIRKSMGMLEQATGLQGTPAPGVWPFNQTARTPASEMKRRTYTPQKPPMTSEFDVSDTVGFTPARSFLTPSAKLSMSMGEPTRNLQASMLSSPQYDNSMLDQTGVTMDMTRANLLLQEDPGQLATEGLFDEFLNAFKKHQSLTDVFALVSEYERLCHEQVTMLDRLMTKTLPSQKSFSRTLQVLRLLTQEKATWRLIGSLYQDRQMSAEDQDPGSIIVDRIHTEHLSEREIADSLFERDAVVRQHQIVVDWLESVAADQSAFSYNKVQFYSHSVCWENTLHDLQQRAVSGSSTRETMVTSLDPDAPIRENRPLADLDKEDETRLLLNVFANIRAGKLEEAQRLCKESGQAWRAASLEGWRLYHDRNMTSVHTSGDLAPIEGNMYRDIWKNVCWRMAEDERFHLYERAIYAVLSGNLRELLPACDLWEDCLWGYFKVLVDQEVEREIRDQLRSDRALQPLPQGYYTKDLTPPKIFQELHAHPNQKVEAQAKEKLHLIQKYIILGDIDTLLEEMSEWLRENNPRPSHHLVRFMAHLALTLRSLGLQTREEICVSVIEAYVKDLISDNKTELVAIYVSQLPADLQVVWYAKFLEGIHDKNQRQYCLQLAEDAGLDVAAITKKVVETLRFKEDGEPGSDIVRTAALEAATSQEDRRKIEAIDWLVFDPSQRAEAVKQSNAIIRTFLATTKHDAAREVFKKLPEDSIDVIIRNWKAMAGSVSPPAEDTNAIREYLCIKAYLDALDAYNDWFAHYHNKKPGPPCLPDDANFHDKVRYEHEHKEYEMELERWDQTVLALTKGVSDTMYNVLLFVDGGWMVDQTFDEEDEEVDEVRLSQMQRLRELCIPKMCLLLHSVLHSTRQFNHCLVLADIMASEQYQLYKVFRKPELKQVLSRLRESSLQLLDQNLDALGYEIAS